MIDFIKESDTRYIAEFESTGSNMIQVESNKASVWVHVKIEDTNQYDTVKLYTNLYNQLIQMNLKPGMKIRLVSNKPAKYSIK